MDKVVKLTSQNSSKIIQNAKSILAKGEVIAVPTDTIYGLACDANSTEAIDKLYKIKKRDLTKPIALCVGSITDIYNYAKVSVEDTLLRELLPGPVTLIFERSAKLNIHLNPHTNLVGIRIPDNKFIQDLCKLSGAVALTSANISSEPSCLAVNEFNHLWDELGLVIDGGRLGQTDPQKLGSTVIDLSIPGRFKIVRDGCAKSKTMEILEKYGVELM